ncbi:MAG: cation diffusion facilitator family transporter [Bacteroidales bacterium]|nr:cation diffusion facilitator family transporter [Bacteroidales bacterium]
MKDSKDKNKLAYSEGWLSISVNIVLFGLKYWAGIVSGSIALISDAWHSLSDSISSIAVIVGIKISSKPPDKHHPYGHGRAELITSLIIGILLVIVAVKLIIDSIANLKDPGQTEFGTLAIVIIIVSIIIKELSAQYAFYTARKTGFISLKADGWHHRSDAVSSVLILIGIFISPYFPLVDGILGIIISLFILHTAFSILKETASAVLGESPDAVFIKQLSDTANNSAGFDLKLHHIHMHKYGRHTEVSFHICLPENMTVSEAHNIATKIETDIYKQMQISVTTHIDPDNEKVYLGDDNI